MGSLDVYYVRGQDKEVLSTPAQIPALIERVRSESNPDAGVLANVFLSDDPYEQILVVGVAPDRGVVRYAGRQWPDGVVSTNKEAATDGELGYFYMKHWHEFPTNSEISLALVVEAVTEFMTADGERPTCIDWQPSIE